MNLLKRFVKWNISLCDAIEARLPGQFTRSLLYLHELTVAEHMKSRPGARILDVGGGHQTPFAAHRLPGQHWIIGSDILEEPLRRNTTLDSRVVADACGSLPFSDGSIDIIATRSVMEHLPDNARFATECWRVLKGGGVSICVMPSRRAPFALLNRLLPEALKRRMLFAFFPEYADTCGFRAYYNRCAWPLIGQVFEASGFRIERVEFRYYQSIYFKVLLPLYLVSLFYDLSIWYFSVNTLCCQMLIIARRPERT